MNLHGIVRGPIRAVNPDIAAVYLSSNGTYTTGADGKRTPNYTTTNVTIQVQGVSAKDIERCNGLGIQGVLRKVYAYGNVAGIVRADGKGGDVLQFPEVPGGVVRNWKVTNVGETWPDWSSVIVVLQTS